MAFSNEVETKLFECPKGSDILMVKKIENTKNGNVSVDLRLFYTDSSDGLVKPSKKGIRVNSETLLDIMKAMAEVLEEDEREDLGNFLLGEGEDKPDDDDCDEDDCDEDGDYDEEQAEEEE